MLVQQIWAILSKFHSTFLAENLKTPSTLLQDHQSRNNVVLYTTDTPGIATSLDFLHAPWKLTTVFHFASNLKQIN